MRKPEDLVTEIQSIEKDLQEVKSGPQFFGTDSLITYLTFDPAAYDFTTTLTLGQLKQYRITLTHAEADRGALINLNIYYRLDNPNVMADSSQIVNRHPSTNPQVALYWHKETYGDTYTTWIFTLWNIAFVLTPVPYLKFFFDGSDTGTWQIAQI